MTVLVGVRCSNGVVIGSDSAVTYAPVADPQQLTAEVSQGLKISVIENDIIVAITGEVGLGQRLVHILERAIGGQIAPLQQQLQQAHQVTSIRQLHAVEAGTCMSALAAGEIQRTRRQGEQHMGLSALVGMVLQGEPRLLWFDPVYFRPELVGERDPNGQFRTLPLITSGSGQRLADPFLLHAHRVLFGEKHFPTTADGRLLTAYTLDHVIRYNTGTVGGDPHIVSLEESGGSWVVRHSEVDEARQQVQTLESYIRDHRTASAKDAPSVDDWLSIGPEPAQAASALPPDTSA